MKVLLLALVLLFQFGGAVAWADGSKPDYRSMVDRIDAMLSQAVSDYRAGRIDDAKAGVQDAYFQIFEDMEGPIRINISAKRSYELESEFGAIRKLMSDGAPADEIAQRIAAHEAALRQTMPALEGGAVLVGRASSQGQASPQDVSGTASSAAAAIEPYWQQAVATIDKNLLAAADALDKGNKTAAKDLITKALFDGYRNSQLTIAIRKFISQQQDGDYKSEFSRLSELADAGGPSALIRNSAQVLTQDMTYRLRGVPLVDGVKEAAPEPAVPSADWNVVAAKIDDAVARALALAGSGDRKGAVNLLQSTYFDVFEASGMEDRVGARDESSKTALEAHFSKLVALVSRGAPAETLAAEADTMRADLARAATLLGGSGQGGMLALFGYALLIIVREGFEAMIVVAAIIAYLVKTGNHDKLGVITNSVMVALLASVATAVVLKLGFREAGASQEVLEGATMLFAAVVLFSVSCWLISKAEARKWSSYIKGKLEGSLSSGSMKALWFTSFLAVYREGAETVLFYQALTTDADRLGLMAIVAGFVVGCLVLGVIYLVMRVGAVRLPVRPFFQATGALLYLMAFVFAGQGIMELVEGRVFVPTLIPGLPEIQILGVYPYWQSLLPQALLVIAAVISMAVILRRKLPARADGAPTPPV